MDLNQDMPSAKRQRLVNNDVPGMGQGEDPSMMQFTSERLTPSETPPSPIPGVKPPTPINVVKKEARDVSAMNQDTPDVKVGGSKVDGRYKNLKLNTVVPAGGGVKKEDAKPEGSQAPLTGAYMSREENLQEMEDAGKIQFSCAGNDGVVQHMIWLIGLKNIFSKQLPNMPKEYIVRLVMDRNHKSMMLIKQNQVIGGITYRPYPAQRFGEIAFCAITSTEQVKGFGTRLMNQLKQHARDVDNLEYFLTYADNNAVGYFGKQGFTKEITMDRERWHGYIKDYDGGTLMECHIHPKLPHTTLPVMLRKQKQAIEEKVRQLSNQHIIHSGLDIWKKAGYGRKAINVEDIPGVKEAGWQPDPHSQWRVRLVNAAGDRPPSKSSLHVFMRSVLRAVGDHPDAWPFKEPVNARDVPDYYEIIKDPMDLKTIARRLEGESYYVTLEIFNADMRRVFSNARIYNAPDTIYYKASTKLETFSSQKMKNGLQIGGRPLPSHRPGTPLLST